jgi:CarD family transcriptional regulator
MNYKINDYVIHLSHGFGKITGIETRQFGNETTEFYILEINDYGSTKKVFVDKKMSDSRLRKPIDKTKLDMVYNILSKGELSDIDHQTWNRRYREYMELIHSGDIFAIASVVNSLFLLKQVKDLSFGERKLLDQGLNLLVIELSLVENKSKEEIEHKIKSIFNE